MAIVNSAAMNIGVHESFWIMFFSGYMTPGILEISNSPGRAGQGAKIQRCDAVGHIWGNAGVEGVARAAMRSFIQSTAVYCAPTVCQAVFKAVRFQQ